MGHGGRVVQARMLRLETAAGLDAAQGWHEAVIDLNAVPGVDAAIVLTVRW
jgi:hypothetical protein